MCTLSAIPSLSGESIDAPGNDVILRIVFNRDEERTRPESLAPALYKLGDRTVIMPLDPPSGGTWIGASDAGMVACLVNLNSGVMNLNAHVSGVVAPRAPGRLSRGLIVPEALARQSLSSLHEWGTQLRASDYPPFRLLLLDCERFTIFISDGSVVTIAESGDISDPLLLASSGLGDSLVQEPRRRLFDQLLSSHPDRRLAQDTFHRTSWPDSMHTSVMMSRAAARTVSITTIELSARRIEMFHEWMTDESHRAASPVSLTLPMLPKLSS